MPKKRRHFTATEKMQIIEEARAPGAVLAEVLRRHQLKDSQFYRWESQAKKGMLAGLMPKQRGQNGADAQVEQLRKELQRKNDVIAELTEALILEKKGLSDYLRRRD